MTMGITQRLQSQSRTPALTYFVIIMSLYPHALHWRILLFTIMSVFYLAHEVYELDARRCLSVSREGAD